MFGNPFLVTNQRKNIAKPNEKQVRSKNIHRKTNEKRIKSKTPLVFLYINHGFTRFGPGFCPRFFGCFGSVWEVFGGILGGFLGVKAKEKYRGNKR